MTQRLGRFSFTLLCLAFSCASSKDLRQPASDNVEGGSCASQLMGLFLPSDLTESLTKTAKKFFERVQSGKVTSARQVDHFVEKILREEAKESSLTRRFLNSFSQREKLHRAIRASFLQRDIELILDDFGLLKTTELTLELRRHKRLIENYRAVAFSTGMNAFLLNATSAGFIQLPALRVLPRAFREDLLSAYARGGFESVYPVLKSEFGQHARFEAWWQAAIAGYYISFAPGAIAAVWTGAEWLPLAAELAIKGKKGLAETCREEWGPEKLERIKAEQMESWLESGRIFGEEVTQEQVNAQRAYLDSISSQEWMEMTCGALELVEKAQGQI